MHFQQVYNWCWWCWSGGHTLRSPDLDLCLIKHLPFLSPLLSSFLAVVACLITCSTLPPQLPLSTHTTSLPLPPTFLWEWTLPLLHLPWWYDLSSNSHRTTLQSAWCTFSNLQQPTTLSLKCFLGLLPLRSGIIPYHPEPSTLLSSPFLVSLSGSFYYSWHTDIF